MGQASPYLLSLGLNKSGMAIVFLAGPLSGKETHSDSIPVTFMEVVIRSELLTDVLPLDGLISPRIDHATSSGFVSSA